MRVASRRTGTSRVPDAADVRVTARARAPLSAAGVARLAAAVLRAEGAPVAALSITFVGPLRMRALNRTHLGHDRVTDVLAFGMQPAVARRAGARGSAPGPGAPVVADIYICPAVAARAARRYGITAPAELRRLVIHGILHVLGYDHPDGAERTTSLMWRRQEQLLARWGRLAT